MDNMLQDTDGARAAMDNSLVARKTSEEHDQILKKKCEKKKSKKIELRWPHSYFKWPIARSIKNKMPLPQNMEDIRRIRGLVQYLPKFIPNMTNVIKSKAEFYSYQTWDQFHFVNSTSN